MKHLKKIVSVFLGMMVVAMLSGCSSKNHIEVDTDHHEVLEDAPQWVLNPEAEGYVVGLGSSSYKEDVAYQFQREEALMNARADLAKKIISEFKNESRSDYLQNGTEDIGESRSFRTVNTSLSDNVMRGSKQINIWISPENGELFLLVGIAPENIEYKAEESEMTEPETEYRKVVYVQESEPVILASNTPPVDPVIEPIPILDKPKPDPIVTF